MTSLYLQLNGPTQPRTPLDTLTPAERSERMSLVRGKDTRPELLVRRLLHAMGYRYRLHGVDLPGKPDLLFPVRRKIILVHGCFWHRHPNTRCKLARLPKSGLAFWVPKLEANRARDLKHQRRLRAMGWRCLVVWECQLNEPERLSARLRQFLNGAETGTK